MQTEHRLGATAQSAQKVDNKVVPPQRGFKGQPNRDPTLKHAKIFEIVDHLSTMPNIKRAQQGILKTIMKLTQILLLFIMGLNAPALVQSCELV